MSQGPKRLFKYYMDKNIAKERNELQFFRRLNRWRFESANLSGALKSIKLKGPILFAFGFVVLYDQLTMWNLPEPYDKRNQKSAVEFMESKANTQTQKH